MTPLSNSQNMCASLLSSDRLHFCRTRRRNNFHCHPKYIPPTWIGCRTLLSFQMVRVMLDRFCIPTHIPLIQPLACAAAIATTKGKVNTLTSEQNEWMARQNWVTSCKHPVSFALPSGSSSFLDNGDVATIRPFKASSAVGIQALPSCPPDPVDSSNDKLISCFLSKMPFTMFPFNN